MAHPSSESEPVLAGEPVVVSRRGAVFMEGRAPPGRQSQRTSAAGGGAALAERVKSGQATVSHGVPELPPDFLSLGTASWREHARP